MKVVFIQIYRLLAVISFLEIEKTQHKKFALARSNGSTSSPQHLWLECYFFFVSSNKEKVTKKACPEQGRGETNCYLSFVRAKER